jgi:LysM repeat protein
MAYDLYMDGVRYPVTPSKVSIKTGNNNKTINLINEGEVNVTKSAGLMDISFDLLLPNSKYPFAVYTDGYQNAGYYIGLLQELKQNQKKFQFILSRSTPTGNNLHNTNITVTMEDLTIADDTKEGMDAKATVKLKEWREYGTKTVKLNTSSNTVTITEERAESSDAPTGGTTYTVQKGDSLWKIAKQFYGDGSQYTKIYNANTGTLSDPNKIYTGQVLAIPS